MKIRRKKLKEHEKVKEIVDLRKNVFKQGRIHDRFGKERI